VVKLVLQELKKILVPVLTALSPKVKALAVKFKDPALFVGWIAGLIVIGALTWVLLRPQLSFDLMRTINRTFIASGESRRLAGLLSRPPARSAPLGVWYTLYGSDDLFYVFTIMQDGLMIPCGARVTPEGRVVEVIPVSRHARRVFDRLSGEIIRIYTRRIENVAVQWSKK
jgi:hypothetical protein